MNLSRTCAFLAADLRAVAAFLPAALTGASLVALGMSCAVLGGKGAGWYCRPRGQVKGPDRVRVRARVSTAVALIHAFWPRRPRSRPARTRRADARTLARAQGDRGDGPAARGRRAVDLLRGTAYGQRPARPAPRVGPGLQGPLPPLSDHAGP